MITCIRYFHTEPDLKKGRSNVSDDREYYIEEFRKARESGKYYLYGENPEEMTLEELQDAYITMQNYLSDARTHDF